MGAKGMRVDTSRETAVAQGGKKYAAGPWADLPRCPDCNRPMRPYRATDQDFPATVVRAGGGYCSTHYAARRLKNTLSGDRQIDCPPPSVPERRAMADGWNETERNAALVVCSFVTEPKEAYEMMSMLGLFNEERGDYVLDLLHVGWLDRQ